MSIAFRNMELSGVCKCGKFYSFSVKLPTSAEARDNTGQYFKLEPAEHMIFTCPNCKRLVNAGNGTQRRTKRRKLIQNHD